MAPWAGVLAVGPECRVAADGFCDAPAYRTVAAAAAIDD
jgi:hypothetical protein